MLASLCRTCKPERRNHKHKRKERKLKNSDRFSAYILVTDALPFAKWRHKFLYFYACVCHLKLMLIARVNILVVMLVLMVMLASYV